VLFFPLPRLWRFFPRHPKTAGVVFLFLSTSLHSNMQLFINTSILCFLGISLADVQSPLLYLQLISHLTRTLYSTYPDRSREYALSSWTVPNQTAFGIRNGLSKLMYKLSCFGFSPRVGARQDSLPSGDDNYPCLSASMESLGRDFSAFQSSCAVNLPLDR
jgi:hypothetical protein